MRYDPDSSASSRVLHNNAPMSIADVIGPDEHHLAGRAGWLRAAVLGANDGLVSTAALMVGVAAASSGDVGAILAAGVAGVAAGAMSMGVGEYVSVSSQADIETADRLMEEQALRDNPEQELAELAAIYRGRGLTAELAAEVAKQMTEFDALTTHLRDEVGQHDFTKPRPMQAALASAAAFTVGGLIPFLSVFWPESSRAVGVAAVTLVGLVIAGILSAKAAGCGLLKPTIRVVLGGSFAMAITTAVGLAFNGLVG